MQTASIAVFKKKIWSHFHAHGRHDLPWRKTTDPYRILVSEVMLQQTQVDRVIPKYKEFLKLFPTTQVLARASLKDVLRAWSGLGYNRRAKMLQEAAKSIVEKHGGKFPKARTELEDLPGVGPYTAGAVMAFAFNEPATMIETNIRSVFLHEFYKRKSLISDAELMKLIEKTVDKKKPREWYWALMDYGARLKKTKPNPSRRSKHHTKQSKFEGSDRQVRGAALKLLTESALSDAVLRKRLAFEGERVDRALVSLAKEGLIQKKGRSWRIT